MTDSIPNTNIERAVEAALPIIRTARCGGNDLYWCTQDREGCHCLATVADIIAAADQARGRSYIDWRRPDEFKQKPDRWVMTTPLPSGDRITSVRSHWSAEPWPPAPIAWAEMPAPPAWCGTAPISDAYLIWDVDTEKWFLSPMRGLTQNEKEAFRYTLEQAEKAVAASSGNQTIIRDPQADTPGRTATDGQCSPGQAPSIPNTYGCPRGNATCQTVPECDAARRCLADYPAPRATTHETPGAAVLAGGASDEDLAWNTLIRAAHQWATHHMDQWDKFKFGTRYGPVYVSLVRQTPWPDDFVSVSLPGETTPPLATGQAPEGIKKDVSEPASFTSTTVDGVPTQVRYGSRPLGKNATRLSDLELRVIALEQGGADTQGTIHQLAWRLPLRRRCGPRFLPHRGG